MEKLNLPDYRFRFRKNGNREEIFDGIRKKFVALTPEEWVRQHFVRYLTSDLLYPASLIGIEPPIKVFGLKKRPDILVYSGSGKELLLVECKATRVKITQEVFDQVFSYNMSLKAGYIAVTNGMQHYCCRIPADGSPPVFLEQIPFYRDLEIGK